MLLSRYFVILILFAAVRQITSRIGRHKVYADNHFDLLIFTQHWPETVCFEWEETAPSHQCFLPRHQEWTIHGLWPSQKHEIAPAFCNKTQHFDESVLLPIQNQMEEKWINIEKGTPHFSLWKHEWEKHGTCASVLPELDSELKYFKKGLELQREYDMTHVLAKCNILPGKKYEVQAILDCVNRILGHTAQVECVTNSKTHESLLFEIRICFDKSLKLIDCNDVPAYPTNCQRKKPVTYPGIVPSEYNVILV
ncbi:ribonuclease Oy-like [Athalia rosae]|uniref:ribonuclease Oy-like n=1 Tax=Athalia rosae TaxID=37344 RepID=UPI002033E433|nr:ribonuclease Oy-like [Athalia rosae]